MPAVLLTPGYQDWKCPECGLEERTRPYPPNSARMHVCPKLHMLTAPMVPLSADCKITAVERADYLAGEIQAAGDDGRAYMAVRTDYADGRNDLAVNAPCATATFSTD